MTSRAAALLLALAGVLAGSGARSAIVQDVFNAGTSFGMNPGIGQSFTAEATIGLLDRIEFRYDPAVNTTLPAPVVTMDLFAGAGYGGALLGSATRPLSAAGVERWEAFFFQSIPLVPGDSYTFRLTGSGSGFYRLQSGSDPYPGGDRLDSTGAPVTGLPGDLAFRIFGEVAPPTPIPLPAGGGLLAIGAVLLAWVGRRAKGG